MNKRILVIVGLLLVVIVGAVVATMVLRPTEATLGQTSPAATQTSRPPTAQPETESETEVAPTPGVYVDYTESAIANAEGTALLFFHAPWCPQCRAVEADILSMGVPAGITIIKVDYDSNQGLRQQYGVTLQTTFVEVDASGAGLQSFVAYDDPRLAAVLDAML
jgi:thiol-disulfide isomerase/thioredoxin